MRASVGSGHLLAALGDRPMETLRIANAFRPRHVTVFVSRQSSAYFGPLARLLQSKLSVESVDAIEVDQRTVIDVKAHVAQISQPTDPSASEGYAIAASGGTKPMIWGLQRWYDSLDERERVGAYAVDEADGRVLPLDSEALRSTAPPGQPFPDLSLQDIGDLHLVTDVGATVSIDGGSPSGRFLESTAYYAAIRAVCGAAASPGGKVVLPGVDAQERGALLERLVAQRGAALGFPGEWHLGVTASTQTGRRFELDVVRVHDGRLWVLECKHTEPGYEAALQDLAEVALRARQLGGSDARSALLTLNQARAHQLNEMEYLWVWHRPRVLGPADLANLLGCHTASDSEIGEFFAQ